MAWSRSSFSVVRAASRRTRSWSTSWNFMPVRVLKAIFAARSPGFSRLSRAWRRSPSARDPPGRLTPIWSITRPIGPMSCSSME